MGGVPSGPVTVEVVQVRTAEAGEAFGLGEIGAAAHPELAVAAVPVERATVVPRRPRPQVQHRLAVRFQYQDVPRLVLARQPGQPGVGAVRAEAVIAVVERTFNSPAGTVSRSPGSVAAPGPAAGEPGEARDAGAVGGGVVAHRPVMKEARASNTGKSWLPVWSWGAREVKGHLR